MKKYADSTLFRMTKSWLIDYVRCLEHNIAVEQERNERQFQMLMEYEIKKQDGTLIELPCKPNEIVYMTDKYGTHQTMYVSKSGIVDAIESGHGIGYTKEESVKMYELGKKKNKEVMKW